MKKLIFLLVLSFFIQQSNSQTWVQKLNGISMWSLCKDYSGTKIYAGTSGTVRAIYRSTNYGSSWDTVLSNGVTNFLYLACDSSNGVYAANVSNGLLKSNNGGINWTTIPSGTFNNKSVQSVICGLSGYVYVGTITGGIFRSTDGGTTFPDNTLTTLTIVSLAVDRNNSHIIYAGASSGSPPNYGFYRSTDDGATWSSNLNPLNIWGIVQRPNGNLYTVTTSSPYNFDRSTNGGLNWSTLTTIPGAMRGLCIGIGGFYASGNGGVFRSRDDDSAFVNFNFTYSANQIISAGTYKIFVAVSGTSNGGVWIYDEPWFGIQKIGNEIPNKFELMQNYPNPFNPLTNIRFTISELSHVKLFVYDIQGREIQNLVNRELYPGTYEVDWNASNHPSGVYFYKLTAGDFSETRKAVLIK
jgi:hypothetical protein